MKKIKKNEFIEHLDHLLHADLGHGDVELEAGDAEKVDEMANVGARIGMFSMMAKPIPMCAVNRYNELWEEVFGSGDEEEDDEDDCCDDDEDEDEDNGWEDALFRAEYGNWRIWAPDVDELRIGHFENQDEYVSIKLKYEEDE